MVPRSEPRSAEQRAEPRHEGLVDRAILVFRGQEHLVPLLNVSNWGAMAQTAIEPRIGEMLIVQMENGARLQAFVRWIREGRVGLNFAHEVLLGRD
jgi:hypothetical protein